MAQQYSFDIVSEIDLQEVDNAVNQALKELSTRFDFKGSKSTVEFLKTDKKIRLTADDDMKLRNLQDILKTRIAGRKISMKALDFKPAEKAFEGTLRQDVTLISGIEQDHSKQIVRAIKDAKLKVQASIQGEQVRVTSKSKDDLQTAIQLVKSMPLSIPVQFTNYR
ncbi:MAG: YajQ family cyclic di-GMP-binding protein [Omnitrophica bacterium GWA2_52_8]|nr:MAG: YajQ family cyclic di-GMP-binding protein [Omnitrophica bacterium GWA2_52_8]